MGFVLDPPVRVPPWQYMLEQEFVPFSVTIVPVLLDKNEYGASMGLKESYDPVATELTKLGNVDELTTNPMRILLSTVGMMLPVWQTVQAMLIVTTCGE
jgi:hypothetical protein